MPVQHTWESGVLVISGDGYYPFEDFMAPIRAAVLADPMRESFALLADLSRSEAILMRPTREIVRGARELALYRSHIRRAAAVVGSTVVYGIARMGTTYATLGGADASVFWTRGDAMKWLLEGCESVDSPVESRKGPSELPPPRRP